MTPRTRLASFPLVVLVLALAAGGVRASDEAVDPMVERLRLEPVDEHPGFATHRTDLVLTPRSPEGVVPGKATAPVVLARRFTYGASSIDLVDLDGDGEIRAGAGDGYRESGNPLTLPLPTTLIVGADRLTLRSITDTEVVVRVQRLGEDADQRVGLASINRHRLHNGLPPVTLDAELSAACTAHARYLRANHWNGYTNPHTESEDAPGYTPEGARAARAGVIMQAGHDGALRAYFRTYYHRAPFVDPYLERVGVSSGESWISVIDATSGAPLHDEPPKDWTDPILVPADGATNVETHFCRWGEVPAPAPQAAERGFPLTLVFARWDHGVLDVHAQLVRIDDEGKEVPVETLVPEAIQESKLMGVVPARPLLPETTYRVRYRLERFEEPDQLVEATFTTAPTSAPRRR